MDSYFLKLTSYNSTRKRLRKSGKQKHCIFQKLSELHKIQFFYSLDYFSKQKVFKILVLQRSNSIKVKTKNVGFSKFFFWKLFKKSLFFIQPFRTCSFVICKVVENFDLSFLLIYNLGVNFFIKSKYSDVLKWKSFKDWFINLNWTFANAQ